MRKSYLQLLSIIVAFMILSSCVTTPPYDQTEYDRIITLKVDSLDLLKNASKEFSIYKAGVDKIRKDMTLMYEYAKNLPNNDESIKQIEIMNNPEGTLLGKALKDWEYRGTLSEAYLAGLLKNIAEGFDQISGLISKRIKK